jgi:hypothetical protein
MKLRIIHDKYLERYFVQKKFLWWWNNLTESAVYNTRFENGFRTLKEATEYEKWYVDLKIRKLQAEHQDKLNRTAKNRMSLIRQDDVKVAYLYFQTPE